MALQYGMTWKTTVPTVQLSHYSDGQHALQCYSILKISPHLLIYIL